MRHRILTGLLLIASLSAIGLAQANPGHGNGHGNGHDKGHRHHHERDGRRGHGDHGDRGHDRHDYAHRGWHRGGRVPNHYRDNRYYVSDWHGHHLSAPPRGHRWLRIDGDYVLAAVATGVIAAIVVGR